MKIAIYKITTLLLLLPLLVFSNGIEDGKYKKTRTVDENFKVNKDALLNISNKYGNVDITTWNKNSIQINVEITVSGNDENRVLDKFKAIKIDFDGMMSEVSAVTHTNRKKSNSWFFSSWFNWGSSNINYEINYKVKMPITNDLNVSNDYGTILINELDGKAIINCDYGKLIIGALNHSNNKINIDYASHSTIEFIDGGRVNADYSKFTIEKANDIVLYADYTTSIFENVRNLNYTCDYGSLTVGKAYNVKGNGDYLSVKFETILKKIQINADYGSIKITELRKGFETVKIVADYTGVRIGIDSKASCNIKAKLSFGSFKYTGEGFTFNKKKVSSTDKYYEGYYGSPETESSISTTTDFGSVKLFEY